MPKAGFPLATDALLLLELARGPGTGSELLRRVRHRMGGAFVLHYGTFYPALDRLLLKRCVEALTLPQPHRPIRPLKRYALSQEGAKAVRRISTALHRIILPIEAAT